MKKNLPYLLLCLFCCLTHKMVAQQPVTWTDISDISITGGTISKTGVTGYTTGGAASVEQLELVTDGWVKATITETNTNRFIGLSNINQNTHYSTINFAIYLTSSGQVQVYENGSRKYNSGLVYSTGQEIKVQRLGTQVKYWLGTNNFYNSQAQSNLKLIVDLGFYETGSSLENITISGDFSNPGPSNTDPSANGVIQTVTWTDVENIAYIDDKIVKTTPTNWDAGAVSTKRLEYATNGWVEATIFETNTNRVVGLSKDNPNTHYSSIDMDYTFP